MNYTRKQALKTMAAGAAGAALLPNFLHAMNPSQATLKGNINHSVCQWCYSSMPIEQLVMQAKAMGIKSIDLLRANEWALATKQGLTCAMGYATSIGLTQGFNDPTLHDRLQKDYTDTFPKAAEAGIKNIICFSGNRNGISDAQGLENCARGLDLVVKAAARYNITVSMELLNSKVDHKDYHCDHTEWGVKLVEKLGAPNFKLLYDIYHMQIMEGDVIATITKYNDYISHYHTGGVPGRHEIDEGQELFYPAIMRAIVKTGFKGYVAQEFIPSRDPMNSLKAAVTICDV